MSKTIAEQINDLPSLSVLFLSLQGMVQKNYQITQNLNSFNKSVRKRMRISILYTLPEIKFIQNNTEALGRFPVASVKRDEIICKFCNLIIL